MTTIVVTGATGRLGGRVARRLGGEITLLVRDPSRAPAIEGARTVTADYTDGEAVRAALDGARTVFMVSAAETPDRVEQHRTFVDAARAAGVEHLVYTSFAGAAEDATFTLARDHWHTEQYIRSTGMAFTFLRDNLYADFLPMMAGPDGIIRGPAGDGRVALVAQDDIADAAVAVLRDVEQHAAKTFELTGPQALTLTEAAAIASDTTGREVRFQDETVAEAYASRKQYGAPRWQVDAWVSTYTAMAAGELAAVSDELPRLAGHPATDLRTLLSS